MQIIETAGNSRLPLTDNQKEEVKQRIKKMQKEGEKLVKGMFEFIDAQGGWFDFSYRFFPGEPIRTVKLVHGEICEIPMILAKHLNNCHKKVRIPPKELDEGGKPRVAGSVTKISRLRFTPMDMM
jgi:hypothetical protein